MIDAFIGCIWRRRRAMQGEEGDARQEGEDDDEGDEVIRGGRVR